MGKANVLFAFQGETDCELSLNEGEIVTIIDRNVGEGWWMAR